MLCYKPWKRRIDRKRQQLHGRVREGDSRGKEVELGLVVNGNKNKQPELKIDVEEKPQSKTEVGSIQKHEGV